MSEVESGGIGRGRGGPSTGYSRGISGLSGPRARPWDELRVDQGRVLVAL